VIRCRGGDVLTIRGMNLRSERDTHIRGFPTPDGYQVCETLPSEANDATVLHCQLRGPESDLQEDVVFPMLWDARIPLAEHVEVSTFGNPFWVSFTREQRLGPALQCLVPPESPLQWNEQVSAAPVVLAVVVTVLVMVKYWVRIEVAVASPTA